MKTKFEIKGKTIGGSNTIVSINGGGNITIPNSAAIDISKSLASYDYMLSTLTAINGMIADASNVEGGKVNLGLIAKLSMSAINKSK